MNKKILVLIIGMFLLVVTSLLSVPLTGKLGGIGMVEARDFSIFNSSNVAQNYFVVNGTTGDSWFGGNVSAVDDFCIVSGLCLSSLDGLSGSINSSAWNRSGTNVFLANDGDNVGIGTTTPGMPLQVNKAGTSGQMIGISHNYGLNAHGDIDWMVDGTPTRVMARINSIVHAANNIGIAFHTSDDDGTSITEAMRILGNGNVGIGTTSPASTLTVNNATGKVGLLLEGAGTDVFEVYVPSAGANHDVVMGTISNNPLYIKTSDTVRMTIGNNANSGNVGIGTTSPDQTLQVNGTIETITGVLDLGDYSVLSNSNTNINFFTAAGGWKHNFQISTNKITGDAFQITPSSIVSGNVFSTPAFTILGGGNVGIGTVSPNRALHVTGSILSNATINATGDVCIEGGNCLSNMDAGSLGAVTGAGTAWRIPMWNGTTSLK